MAEGVTMAKRSRRTFTEEFKAEAVRFVRESGKSIAAAARELDLSENALREWVRRADEGSVGHPLTKDERDEVQRLRREILDNATAFFARESR